VDADPADQGHKTLEKGEQTSNAAHFATFHAGLIQAIGKRHGKSIHGKADAQQEAVKEEYKTPFHMVSLRKIKTSDMQDIPENKSV
jgi:hypothetical protein